MTRHKHADLMIAYANDTSLEIQVRDSSEDDWEDIDKGLTPAFYNHLQYRIKPKKGDFICEIDGVKWWLGPSSDEDMLWDDAKEWAEQQGCSLPPREVLLMCYINKDIRKQFKEGLYWSSSEYEHDPAGYAWGQIFANGYQDGSLKDGTRYVRGVISS